jgi:hypothetical protein
MILLPEQKIILQEAIEIFGDDHQIDLWFEESAELTKELCKTRRCIGDPYALAEEIADCKIMLAQLEMIYANKYLVRDIVGDKIMRLAETIKKEKTKNGRTQDVCEDDCSVR